MPQYTTCVRCGSILPGSNAPVGVEPPRAGKIEKALRLAAVIRVLNRFTGTIMDCFTWAWQKSRPFLKLEIRPDDLVIFTTFWTGILPGLPQWYIGRTPEDKIFFFGWLALLFLTVLTFGLPISDFLLGLIIAWHLASIIDGVIITSAGYSDRFFLFCLMTICAVVVLYLPTSTLCWNHLGVQRVSIDADPFRRGDGLLYTMSQDTIQPQVGDIVLYHAPRIRYQSQTQANTEYRLEGNMFDRVLALEGQTVSWKGGVLTVDGMPSPHQPLVSFAHSPPDTTFIVPAGQCYIIPGAAFQHLDMPTQEQTWQEMGLVPYGSIYGAVWGARRSLFRFVDLHPQNPVGD